MKWLKQRAKREACRQLAVELLRYNKKDSCWDPIGSIDSTGLDTTIELIAAGKLAPSSVEEAKRLFKQTKVRK